MAIQAESSKPKNFLVRFFTMDTSGAKGVGRKLPLWRQLLIQLLCLVIAIEVMFPLMYVITMSLSSKSERPTSLQLFPKEINFGAFKQVVDRPTANPVTFGRLALNSFILSVSVGLISLLIAVSAAYAFSRFNFSMRQVLMILVFVPLLMPGVGLATPLFLLLNSIKFVNCGGGLYALTPFMSCVAGVTPKIIFNLRDSLLGVGIAMISGALPFAIWNLKGYLDTIPKELEEAGKIDGASSNQIFFKIVLPLAVPQLAVTFFLGFIGYWQEFVLPWLFLTKPQNYTLSMTLYNMTGQYATSIPWNTFSAFSIIVAAPVAIIYIILQKQIVSGLTLGGVKG
ncbi:MAG: ABC transporter permease [Anaerolineales bacterium]|nr:MAG: ABC transporter permease [Anaerolineales bacterium]